MNALTIASQDQLSVRKDVVKDIILKHKNVVFVSADNGIKTVTGTNDSYMLEGSSKPINQIVDEIVPLMDTIMVEVMDTNEIFLLNGSELYTSHSE